jgi:hypothetical protein
MCSRLMNGSTLRPTGSYTTYRHSHCKQVPKQSQSIQVKLTKLAPLSRLSIHTANRLSTAIIGRVCCSLVDLGRFSNDAATR